MFRERVGASAESVLSELSEQPEVESIHSIESGGRGAVRSLTVPSSPAIVGSNAPTVSTTRASSVASVCSSGTSGANEDSLSDGVPSPLEQGSFTFDARILGGSKSTRSRAKSLLKRMESLRLRSSSVSLKRKKKGVTAGRLEISGPVLKEGLDEEKLRQLNCVDISTLECTRANSRSISYSTQTSSGSTGSSQSETSSGSTVSTPSPVTRARSHSSANAGSIKRVGMYLEGFDPFSLALDNENLNCTKRAEPSIDSENNRRNRKRTDEQKVEDNQKKIEEDTGVIYFYLPDGHKPGTFPKSLANSGPINHRQGSSTSLDSRLSFYDNVPFSEGLGEDGEPCGDQESKNERVLDRVTGLQRLVNVWAESGPGEDDEDEEEGDSDSALDSASPCPSSPLQNRLIEAENGSDQESTENPLGEQEDAVSARERRDSGVGASLTRTCRSETASANIVKTN